MPTELTDLPDYVRPDVAALAPSRARSRTIAGGTDAVHAAGQAILPQWPGELPRDYEHRATLTEAADFYGRTLEAAVGLLFGAELSFSDPLPVPLAMLEQDADGAGKTMHAIGRLCAMNCVLDGVVGILADYPRVADRGLSVRDVQERRLRPYMVPVLASQVLSWRTARRGAETLLTQLVIVEGTEVPDGAFGVRTELQYRVYQHDLATNVVTVGLLAIDENSVGERTVRVIEPPSVVVGPDRIPFAPGYALPPQSMLIAKPPLDRLAWLNVGHYRVSADHRYLMSICHAPTLAIEGWDGNDTSPVNIGPNAVMRLQGEQKVKWLQAASDALQASEKTMERQSQQMAALGMAFLARDKQSGNETATGRTMDATADRATIGTLADGMGQMLSQALAFCGQYVNAEAPTVTITPDYDATRLDAPTITALSVVAEKGHLSTATLLQILQAGDILPDGLDLEEEERAAKMEHAVRLMMGQPEPEPQPLEDAA
jgi:hypothetical protein